jgi:hypothetical protein
VTALVLVNPAGVGRRRVAPRDAAAKLREARPDADVPPAEDAGHFLPGWAGAAAAFLRGAGS